MSRDLADFIRRAVTPWHAVAEMERRLVAAGFVPLSECTRLEPGDRVYDVAFGSALTAVIVGDSPAPVWSIVGAHCDSPALAVKPGADQVAEGYRRIATEVYGGPILNTWFDRPLGLGGRVWWTEGDSGRLSVSLLELETRFVLPNLAIHMNREVNQGVEINAAKELLPVYAAAEGRDLLTLVAEAAGVDAAAIRGWDLRFFDPEPASFLGDGGIWLQAPRLDNLMSCHAGLEALLAVAAGGDRPGGDRPGGDRPGGDQLGSHAVLFCADTEEVGSRAKNGAASLLLRDRLERVALLLGAGRADFLAGLDRSFLISADLAHAVHPNRSELADAASRPRLNGGPVIKSAANLSYITDAEGAARFGLLCEAAGVPSQNFSNRSDLRGGSTIGPLLSGPLPLPGVDVGTAVWAMHSLRETAGVLDQAWFCRVLAAFYSRSHIP
ncbi:MAG: M18 family aminopeptidase [Bacillota bacterium]|nr:M18 family aminopeptidase [Bacillota bacterium]